MSSPGNSAAPRSIPHEHRDILVMIGALIVGAAVRELLRWLFTPVPVGLIMFLGHALVLLGVIVLIRILAIRRVRTIASLTWRAAFRFRLFWVVAGLLLLAVVVLPLMLKNDGSARGFIQIMLTYTLSVVFTLLAFSTLWLSCGTLAREIEDCQMQMVASKPIARWQI